MASPFRPRAPAPTPTEQAKAVLDAWAAAAQPGDIGRYALRLYYAGKALLFQRRLAPSPAGQARFAYELIRVLPLAAQRFGHDPRRDRVLGCGQVETNRNAPGWAK